MKKLILHICNTSENIILDIVNWIKHTIKLFLFLFFYFFDFLKLYSLKLKNYIFPFPLSPISLMYTPPLALMI